MRRYVVRVAVGVSIALVMMFVHKFARAYPASYQYRHGANQCIGASGYIYGSPLAACSAVANAASGADIGYCNFGYTGTASGTTDISGGAGTQFNCQGTFYTDSGAVSGANPRTFGSIERGSTASCPNGGTLTGIACTCPTGYTDTGTSCTAPPSCAPPKFAPVGGGACQCVNGLKQQAEMNIFGYFSATKPTSGTPCINGCQFAADRAVQWQNGNWYAELLGGLGQACTTPTPAPTQMPQTPTTPEGDCIKSGGYGGTVNGQFMCLSRDTGGVPNQSTGATTTTTTTADNGDGTSTVTTTTSTPTTECSGAGSCSTVNNTTTTTTTINNSTGQPTGPPRTTTGTETPRPTTPEGEKPCTPGAVGCDDEPKSSFGGSCSGFVCDGDAIQCAIASEQHRRNCELLTAGPGLSKADAVASYELHSKGVASGQKIVPGVSGGDVSTMSTGERINAGTLLGATTFATPMGNFVMDLAFLNNPLVWFGYMILSASVLIAARIVMGAF